VCCGIAVLTWYGYSAAEQWRRSSALLVERRAREVVDILSATLTRDMHGAQRSVLATEEWNGLSFDPPYEIKDPVATAFARYPYPEVFFGRGASDRSTVFLARADGHPGWLAVTEGPDRYPVQLASNATIARRLNARIQRDVDARRRYSVFDLDVSGVRYEVVTGLRYADTQRARLDSMFGFMVNMDWVRREYLPNIAQQVFNITEASGLEYVLFEEDKRAIGGNSRVLEDVAARRTFDMLFFDPLLVAMDPPADLARALLSIRVSGAHDPTLAMAVGGARRTLLVIAAAATVLGVGLFITVRNVRTGSELMMMRSEFVSSVTHEIKTPLATIRAIAETLVRGRVTSDGGLRTYAQLLMQEQQHLARLVDNLLAYARVTDVTQAYSFEPQRPEDLATEALQAARRSVTDDGCEFVMNIPAGLPLVRADRTSMIMALDNLIDNAVRYSGPSPEVTLTLSCSEHHVAFTVSDRGPGIPADEIARVQQRFVRGRSARGHGSGLGLAIVGRIVRAHGGRVLIDSVIGIGTKVTLSIPIATEHA
jgi:signal transduction histidine kinase